VLVHLPLGEHRLLLGQPRGADQPVEQRLDLRLGRRRQCPLPCGTEPADLVHGPARIGQPTPLDRLDLGVGQHPFGGAGAALRCGQRRRIGVEPGLHQLGELGGHLAMPGRERLQQWSGEPVELGHTVADRHPGQAAPAGQLVAQRGGTDVPGGLDVSVQNLAVQRSPLHPGDASVVEHRLAGLINQRNRDRVHDDVVHMQVGLLGTGDLVPVGRHRQPDARPVLPRHGADRRVPLQVTQRGVHPGVQRRADVRPHTLIAERPQQAHALRGAARQPGQASGLAERQHLRLLPGVGDQAEPGRLRTPRRSPRRQQPHSRDRVPA
jgi:hypothetical protein